MVFSRERQCGFECSSAGPTVSGADGFSQARRRVLHSFYTATLLKSSGNQHPADPVASSAGFPPPIVCEPESMGAVVLSSFTGGGGVPIDLIAWLVASVMESNWLESFTSDSMSQAVPQCWHTRLLHILDDRTRLCEPSTPVHRNMARKRQKTTFEHDGAASGLGSSVCG